MVFSNHQKRRLRMKKLFTLLAVGVSLAMLQGCASMCACDKDTTQDQTTVTAKKQKQKKQTQVVPLVSQTKKEKDEVKKAEKSRYLDDGFPKAKKACDKLKPHRAITSDWSSNASVVCIEPN